MAAGPQRRTVPAAHLNAQLMPLERALKARAEALVKMSQDEPAEVDRDLAGKLAGQFLALADELHYW